VSNSRLYNIIVYLQVVSDKQKLKSHINYVNHSNNNLIICIITNEVGTYI